MTLDEFRRIDDRHRTAKASLLALSHADIPATEEQLKYLEEALGVTLPATYRTFLGEFGGGSFGAVTVFSAHPDSEWYLARQHESAKRYLPSDVLPFSDDFAGGYFVFHVTGKEAGDEVAYWNQDGGLQGTRYADIFEFVANQAYGPMNGE